MDNYFLNYFYVGRVYQFYLDNIKEFPKEVVEELGFLIPKKDGIEIIKIKKLLNKLIEKENIIIKHSALPKRNGWRIKFIIKNK